ncbi:hypothetical protein EUZ85_23315 [Hahella sp. KA22]|uniref:hypothetical protein n=1 Tax=Hahella sp. KA22 TaxID=1628392 RepID=UPI000FDE23AB|nr:hypothetical protein [Hahella sp. KA22]AZZ93491.1 hypothetical protein ENC22_20735 [Hahella sp. KA22]QAY56865.1 hypothetical protein EUZ85_23315 [Hahella sp. KA22]
MRLLLLLSLSTFLLGCATEKLHLSNAKLFPVEVIGTKEYSEGDPYLFTGTYLALKFDSDTPIDIEDFLNQFRASVIKDDDEIEFSNGILDGGDPHYMSFHKGLMSLEKTDFDRIEFQLRYDPMLTPDYTSNVISFTKEEVLEATRKPVIEY